MNKATYRKTLDVQKQGVQFTVNAVKNEALSRQIILTIVDGGKPFDFDSEDLQAVLYATKPDGTKLYNDCVRNGNTLTYTFTQQTLTTAGDVIARIRIVAANNDTPQVLYAPEFVIRVDDVEEFDTAVQSTNEYTALVTATTDALEAASSANEAATSANAIKEQLIADKEQGLFKGDKGDKGDKGEKGEQGLPGESGTTDYVDLSNKPLINGVELVGNKSLEELNIQEKLTDENLKTVGGKSLLGTGDIELPVDTGVSIRDVKVSFDDGFNNLHFTKSNGEETVIKGTPIIGMGVSTANTSKGNLYYRFPNDKGEITQVSIPNTNFVKEVEIDTNTNTVYITKSDGERKSIGTVNSGTGAGIMPVEFINPETDGMTDKSKIYLSFDEDFERLFKLYSEVTEEERTTHPYFMYSDNLTSQALIMLPNDSLFVNDAGTQLNFNPSDPTKQEVVCVEMDSDGTIIKGNYSSIMQKNFQEIPYSNFNIFNETHTAVFKEANITSDDLRSQKKYRYKTYAYENDKLMFKGYSAFDDLAERILSVSNTGTEELIPLNENCDVTALKPNVWYQATQNIDLTAAEQKDTFPVYRGDRFIVSEDHFIFSVGAYGTYCTDWTNSTRDWNNCYAFNLYDVENHLSVKVLNGANYATANNALNIEDLAKGTYIISGKSYIGCSTKNDDYRIKSAEDAVIKNNGSDVVIMTGKGIYNISRSNPAEIPWRDCIYVTKKYVDDAIATAISNLTG